MTSAEIARLARTLRFVQPSQLCRRAWYALERRRPVPARALSAWAWRESRPPKLRADFPTLPPFRPPRPGADLIASLKSGVFEHLNERHAVGFAEPDWRLGPVSSCRLWTAVLHHHEWARDLADSGDPEGAGLLTHYVYDWIERCGLAEPGARDLAWNSYVTSTRISSWIRAFLSLGTRWAARPAEFRDDFLRSLWQQAAYLHDHIEWDLLANHVLRDAVGLAWAARFFDEPRARAWMKRATEIALAQADEQVLPDGGHFERSPMYHLHVMEDLLSLSLLLEDPEARRRLADTWRRAAEYLAWIRHPDGRIPLFNDGALNGACSPADMFRAGEAAGTPVDASPRRGSRLFPDTGMALWHGDPWSVFFDVGRVGPDYQPGHAHADTLSIECSFRGKRLFVDTGTFSYDNDDLRRDDRATASHNTVGVDGADSSEVWHIFRVGRRALPLNVQAAAVDGTMHACGSHDGYDHLRGRPRHTRWITVKDNGPLIIEDRVEGGHDHRVEAGFLLEPGWSVAGMSGGWQLTNGNDRVLFIVKGCEGLRMYHAARPYHPEFGTEQRATRLAWHVEAALPVSVTAIVEPD